MGPTLLDMSKVVKPGPYVDPYACSDYYSCSTDTHPIYVEYFKMYEGIKTFWSSEWYLLRDSVREDVGFRGKSKNTLGDLNASFYREKRIGVPCSDERILEPTVLFAFVPDWMPFFMKFDEADWGRWVLVRFGSIMTCESSGRYSEYRPIIRDMADDYFADCRFYYGPNMDPWDDEDSEEDTEESPIEKDDKYLISWDISDKKEKE